MSYICLFVFIFFRLILIVPDPTQSYVCTLFPMTNTDIANQMTSLGGAPQSKDAAVVENPTVQSAVVAETNRNDDSNPQQGTGMNSDAASKPENKSPVTGTPTSHRLPNQRPSLKIPPTAKDERKLFVGGLPADSK